MVTATPLVIGIDVDGVLAEFDTPFIELINTISPVQLPPASDTYPDCWGFPQVAGVHTRDLDEVWRQIKESNFFRNLPAMHHAGETLRLLKRLEHDHYVPVYFITARPGREAKWQTEDWLDVCGFRRPTVIVAEHKGPLADALGLTIFIDDKPGNCLDVAKHTSRSRRCEVYMPDRPYNQGTPGERMTLRHHNIHRVPFALPVIQECERRLNAVDGQRAA